MAKSEQRVAVVTGVAGGIGRAIAELFMKEGWTVVGLDVSAEGVPEGVRFVQGDVSDPQAVDCLFTSIQEQEGRVDALVNNAAIQVCRPFQETSVAEWDRVMAVNVRGPFLTLKAAYHLLAHNGGAVVNIASVHALATSPEIAAYAASKGALTAMTRALALELAPRGVRVNAVLPGAVDTEMLRAGFERGCVAKVEQQAHLASLALRQPLGRVGHPTEIAQAVLYFATAERSSYLTGQSLVVDGGVLARLSNE